MTYEHSDTNRNRKMDRPTGQPSHQHLRSTIMITEQNTLSAFDWGWKFDSKPFDTREEAQAYADRFPKYAKVKVTTLTSYTGSTKDGTWQRHEHFVATSQGKLAEDGVNGGVNETGVKRAKAILKDETVIFHQEDARNALDFGEFLTALGRTA